VRNRQTTIAFVVQLSCHQIYCRIPVTGGDILLKMTSDLDLLRQFVRENSQDAFNEIVRRHLNLVHSAALRQVRSPQLAEEIAQSVFADLARNAGKLKPDTILTAWLYSVTRRTAIDVVRKESRRQLREQIAVEMNDMNATANDWTQIEPLLDDAMAALDETDRSAILLRYFENKSLREVGESLKISDDAAQKRVSRAVERLREFFSKQKITIGVSGLAVLISANGVQSAPAALAKTVIAVALVQGAAGGGSTLAVTKGVLKFAAWVKANAVIAVGAGLLLAGVTAALTVELIHQRAPESWQTAPDIYYKFWLEPPYRVEIRPTANNVQILFAPGPNGEFIGRDVSFDGILYTAYGNFSECRTILATPLPAGRFDYISKFPRGAREALRQQIKKQFGITARGETCVTNVLLLVVKSLIAKGLIVSTEVSNRSGRSGDFSQDGLHYWDGRYSFHNVTLSDFAQYCEAEWQMPVLDVTGVTNRFDIDFSWKSKRDGSQKVAFKQAMLDQLGLEFVPTNAPVEMLVVERAKD
jgi:uncharacterized protein (TIGR03435 family)